MAISFRARPILHVFGCGKDNVPFYLGRAIHTHRLNVLSLEFIEVQSAQVSGYTL